MSVLNTPFLLDESQSVGLFDGIRPKQYRGEVKVDRDSGLPLWVVSVSVRLPLAQRRVSLPVEVAAAQVVDLAPDAHIRLHELAISAWSHEGRGGVSFRAAALLDMDGTVLMGAVE